MITLRRYKAHASTSAADRRGTPVVLGGILLVFALALIGFSTLPMVGVGCALLDLSMAGWRLRLGIQRAVTPAPQIAWRTALYLRADIAPPSR